MLRERIDIADERGTTLAELVISMAVGMVVLSALAMVMIVSMHASARVTDRVHATQNARVTLTRVIEELHSACVVPKVAPIQEGASGTVLSFSHALQSEGASASVKPVKTTITLNGTKLEEREFAWLGTTPPTFSKTESGKPVTLATNIIPTPPSSSIFSYYTYSKGKLVQIQKTKLEKLDADSVIQVKVAFTGLPSSAASRDANVGASVENSVMLRLTPPSFREEAGSPPCQ
jgi:hypothetical protein